jgi:SMI1 / KNR4 family (SUKH-1)
MLHSLTNDDNQLLDSFSLSLKENGVAIGNSITDVEIKKFEVNNKVSLPADLKYFLLNTNGFADDEMYAMSRFWKLDEYVKLSSYFKQDIIKDAIPDNDLLAHKKLVAIDGTWLLPDVDNFYLFGDYNVNGSYWAIKLVPESNKETIIICVSDFSNVYRVVANGFIQFIDIFFNQCPEELL